MGDSGSGKTGSLTPLTSHFSLRILDMDNGLETLKQFVAKEHPDRLGAIEYRTLRDEYRATPAGPLVKAPKAYVEATKMLDRWKYDDTDLGVPGDWGPDCILVIDSLTFLANAAFEWAKGLNPNAKDPRQWYGQSQDSIENMLSLVTSEAYETNVIIIAHVKYIETEEGTKGYPTAIGSALSPVIARYFNTVALCRTTAGGTRKIQTKATAMIDLKNPKPFEMEPSYDLSDGMARVFDVLRKQPETKPTTLKRVK